jgi:hypothetical protein
MKSFWWQNKKLLCFEEMEDSDDIIEMLRVCIDSDV